MKQQKHLRQSNLALFLGLLLCAAAMRGQQVDEPAGDRTPKPTAGEVEKPVIETNDATVELQIEKDEGVSLRVSGRRTPEIVKFGSDAIVREGEEVGEVVVIFGDATIDGKVRGNVVVVAGDAKVNGTIGGELVVPLGSAELGSKAHIEGDVTAIGGGIKADPEAKVDGNPTEISWTVLEEKFPPVTGVKNWIMHGLILVRPLP